MEKRVFKPLVPVEDSKGNRIPHLFMRGDKFYAVAYSHGRRIPKSLPSCKNAQGKPIMEDVRRYCAEHVRMVECKDWEAIRETRRRVDRKVATLGEVCTAYLERSRLRNEPRAETAYGNTLALRYIVRRGLGLAEDAAVDAMASDILTAKLKRDCWAAMSAGKEGEAWASARRTMHSKEAAACSVFKWRDDFEGLLLPAELDRFIELDLGRVPAKDYQPPPDEVCELTIAAGRALSGPLGLVWLLCYDLGLRAGEAAAARWSWIKTVEEDGNTWAELRVGPDAASGHLGKSHRSEETRVRNVPIPAGVLAKLKEFAPREVTRPTTEADGTNAVPDYILPDNGPSGRRDLVGRTFAAWLKGLNTYWAAQQKAAHELRKLKGCYWRRRYGLSVTHDWLGHTDYNVTVRYYAKLKGRQEPLALDDEEFVRRWGRRD